MRDFAHIHYMITTHAPRIAGQRAEITIMLLPGVSSPLRIESKWKISNVADVVMARNFSRSAMREMTDADIITAVLDDMQYKANQMNGAE